jgi:hypothetical protein
VESKSKPIAFIVEMVSERVCAFARDPFKFSRLQLARESLFEDPTELHPLRALSPAPNANAAASEWRSRRAFFDDWRQIARGLSD